jgi:hypothetical protein
MVISVDTSVVSFARWLGNTGLMVIENNISHTLQRHLNSFALFDHLIDVLESGYRLRCHANALVLVRSLTVGLGELRDASTSIGHLVQRSLKVEAVQMTFDRLSVRGQASTIELLLLETGFGVVAQ